MSKSLLAIPKGRLYEGISNLFEEIRITLPPADSRQYYYPDFQKDCSLLQDKVKRRFQSCEACEHKKSNIIK